MITAISGDQQFNERLVIFGSHAPDVEEGLDPDACRISHAPGEALVGQEASSPRAKLFWFPLGNNKPVRPWSITSGTPPTRKAIDGMPAEDASTTSLAVVML